MDKATSLLIDGLINAAVIRGSATVARVTGEAAEGAAFGVKGGISTGDILLPGGKPVGYVNSGAGPGIRTVTPQEFSQLQLQLLDGATSITPKSGYPGAWYQRADGTIIGIRTSTGSGTTIDVIKSNNPSLLPGFKVHQK
jgi:filamentous hemagglutinin